MDFRTRALYIYHRLGSQVTDSRLKGDPAVRLDDEKPVESYGATDVAAQRNANAADFGAYPLLRTRNPLAPFELLGATVECFLQECARRILAFPLHCRSQQRLALGAVDAADRHLVNSELARGFRDDRFYDDNPLQAAR